MKFGDGFVFKMGETDRFRNRMDALKREYGECIVLDVFQCDMPHKLEQSLRSTPNFRSNQYTGEINGKTGIELYVSGPDWPWHKIIKSVKLAVEEHMSKSTAFLEFKKLEIESKRIDLEMEKLKIISSLAPERLDQMTYLLNSVQSNGENRVVTHENVDNSSDEEVEQEPEEFYASSTKTIRVQGHQIQRYTPDGHTLLATYDTLKDAERDPELSLDRPHSVKIINAIKSNRAYKGFRWANLDHGTTPDTLQDIGPTVSAPTCRRGQVAVLDPTRKVITIVYDSMTAAAKGLNVSVATISLAMTNSSALGLNKYKLAMFKDCTPEMRDAFEILLAEGGSADAPPKPLLGNAKSIDKLDMNGSLVKTYTSISSAELECKLRRVRIFKAIESGDAIKDGTGGTFKWCYTVV